MKLLLLLAIFDYPMKLDGNVTLPGFSRYAVRRPESRRTTFEQWCIDFANIGPRTRLFPDEK